MKLRQEDKTRLIAMGCPNESLESYVDALNWLTEQNLIIWERRHMPGMTHGYLFEIRSFGDHWNTNIGNFEMQIRYLFKYVLPWIQKNIVK